MFKVQFKGVDKTAKKFKAMRDNLFTDVRKELIVKSAQQLEYSIKKRLPHKRGPLYQSLYKKPEVGGIRIGLKLRQSTRQAYLARLGLNAVPSPYKFTAHPYGPDWGVPGDVEKHGARYPSDKPPYWEPDEKATGKSKNFLKNSVNAVRRFQKKQIPDFKKVVRYRFKRL